MKQEEIIKIIGENPQISAKEMAEKLNLTVDGIREDAINCPTDAGKFINLSSNKVS